MHLEKQNNSKVVLLVGGGTGGHVFPLVAIGEELRVQKRPFIFVGTADSLEQRVVNQLGWRFEVIRAGKLRRYSTFASIFANIIDVFRSFYGFFQAIKIIRRDNIATVFSKGGYVALPVIMAAKLLGCRIVVHESDAVIGLSNRLCSRVADRVLTAFAVDGYPLRNDRFRQVGIPVRSALRRAATLKSPKKSRPLLLILPGSQGSVAINNFVRVALIKLLPLTDVVHLTGERDFREFSTLREKMSVSRRSQYKPYGFIDRELPYYFQSADLLIARASATTIAEAALFSRAMYLIPLPSAAANHQFENATRLEKAGAVVVRQEYQLSSELFIKEITELIGSPERLNDLGKKLQQYFMSSDAVATIIKEIDGTK